MMGRRDFIKGLALIAAGMAARPEQIAAFEHLYEVNTPKISGPLIALDDVQFSGIATTSTRVLVDIFRGDENVNNFAINAFGGIFRWIAAPDQKVMSGAAALTWRISSPDSNDVMKVIRGRVSYLDQDMVRQYRQITSCEGTIGAA